MAARRAMMAIHMAMRGSLRVRWDWGASLENGSSEMLSLEMRLSFMD